MIFGYARVSTDDQHLDLQLDALKAVGCEKVFSEKKSGAKTDRAELAKVLEQLRPGDSLVVWKLDRLGRSLQHLVETVNRLDQQGVVFRSLQESIDTGSATGKLIFHIFASLAEFERGLIRERTNAGLAAARARGRLGGKKKGLSKEADIKASAAKTLYQDGNSVNMIMTQLGIKSRQTLYRWLRIKGVKVGKDEQLATPMNESVELTDVEQEVLTYLQGQLKTGLSGPRIDKQENELATRLCSAWSFGRNLSRFDPDEVALACKRLVALELVEQRDHLGSPSFVPVEFL